VAKNDQDKSFDLDGRSLEEQLASLDALTGDTEREAPPDAESAAKSDASSDSSSNSTSGAESSTDGGATPESEPGGPTAASSAVSAVTANESNGSPASAEPEPSSAVPAESALSSAPGDEPSHGSGGGASGPRPSGSRHASKESGGPGDETDGTDGKDSEQGRGDAADVAAFPANPWLVESQPLPEAEPATAYAGGAPPDATAQNPWAQGGPVEPPAGEAPAGEPERLERPAWGVDPTSPFDHGVPEFQPEPEEDLTGQTIAFGRTFDRSSREMSGPTMGIRPRNRQDPPLNDSLGDPLDDPLDGPAGSGQSAGHPGEPAAGAYDTTIGIGAHARPLDPGTGHTGTIGIRPRDGQYAPTDHRPADGPPPEGQSAQGHSSLGRSIGGKSPDGPSAEGQPVEEQPPPGYAAAGDSAASYPRQTGHGQPGRHRAPGTPEPADFPAAFAGRPFVGPGHPMQHGQPNFASPPASPPPPPPPPVSRPTGPGAMPMPPPGQPQPSGPASYEVQANPYNRPPDSYDPQGTAVSGYQPSPASYPPAGGPVPEPGGSYEVPAGPPPEGFAHPGPPTSQGRPPASGLQPPQSYPPQQRYEPHEQPPQQYDYSTATPAIPSAAGPPPGMHAPPAPALPPGPPPSGPPPGAPPQRGQQPPETADSLDSAMLLGERRSAPTGGWRKLVYKASVGMIQPGESPAEVRRQELITRARTQVVAGHHRVAVMSLKGGVGKTTTTVGLGSTLASIRGDRVIAVDANPDRGTLSDKVRLETAATVRDLLNERKQIHRYADVRAFTSQAPSRLEVLASDRDPAVSEAFSDEDYRQVAQVLEHYYSICITDCGTGLLHSAMSGVLGLADQIVLVSSPSVDGARSASATLDWLEAHNYGALVRNAVVVLSAVRARSKSGVDLDRLEAHFAARCRGVVRVPYDPHLEEGAEVDLEELNQSTQDSYLVLAATVGDGFAWR
jgi:MinD-like ATPase involved in chromosome partitioning or flagellar assembly